MIVSLQDHIGKRHPQMVFIRSTRRKSLARKSCYLVATESEKRTVIDPLNYSLNCRQNHFVGHFATHLRYVVVEHLFVVSNKSAQGFFSIIFRTSFCCQTLIYSRARLVKILWPFKDGAPNVVLLAWFAHSWRYSSSFDRFPVYVQEYSAGKKKTGRRDAAFGPQC